MEGDSIIEALSPLGEISIHSLRMEGDPAANKQQSDVFHFNPLPPHGGRLPT